MDVLKKWPQLGKTGKIQRKSIKSEGKIAYIDVANFYVSRRLVSTCLLKPNEKSWNHFYHPVVFLILRNSFKIIREWISNFVGIFELSIFLFAKFREKHHGAAGSLRSVLPSSRKGLEVEAPTEEVAFDMVWWLTKVYLYNQSTYHSRIGSKYLSGLPWLQPWSSRTKWQC